MGWSLRGRITLAAAGLGSLGCVLLGVGCQEGPFLQTEQFVTRDGQEEQVGTACIAVQKGSGLGGGRAPGVPGAGGEGEAATPSGHSFSYEGTGSGVRLAVLDGSGKTLAERNYDSAFIDAGRKDELKVEADSEKLRFVGWGVAACAK
jgi:hypothetical protein